MQAGTGRDALGLVPVPASSSLRRTRAWLGVALCVVAAGLALPIPARSADPAAIAARAKERGLARDVAWLALLHVRQRGARSHIDQPDFFLHERGAADPEAELDETLRRFLSGDREVACRYPARFHFLDVELGLRQRGLEPQCPDYDAWRANFKASRLTLVFPEAFMNNPASMFGHTLLRIDSGDQGEASDLLAYAVNFAAHTGGENGLSYAIRGIFGFYPGFFSVAPYYKMVERYGDFENRDIWEYELDLEAEEIDQLLRHLYELDDVRFDYYFFDENCSYQLLDLLEVARPGIGLLRPEPPWLIPVDSVRRVRDAGLLREARYRPAAATRLRFHARGVTPDDQRRARAIAGGASAPLHLEGLAPERRAATLSLAYDALRYRMLAGDEEAEATRGRALSLLRARSEIGGVGAPEDPPAPRVRPEQGHRTRRVALETGLWKREPYLELRGRLAFHEILDPEGGYTRGAGIQFFDVAARYLPARNRVRLQEVRLLDIVSIAPRDPLFRPLSWKFATGLATRLRPDGRGDLDAAPVWRNRGGLGGAWDRGPFRVYGFAEALAEWSPELRRNLALGPGLSAGVYSGDAEDRWRGHLYAAGERILLGETGRVVRAGFEQRLRVGSDRSISLDTRWEQRFYEDRFEFALRWNHFF